MSDEQRSMEILSPNVRDPWETDFAAVVPRFTGGLSAISSSLIIYVVVRSDRKLSSIYHRIMFGMSCADICGSIAISLTSLPMPSYMPDEELLGYSWAGARLGNTYTCNAQGFFQTFGIFGMYAYNGMLCVYYVCAIAFAMPEKKIQKYVEPFLHGIPIALALCFAVLPLFFDLYNPDITAFPSCQVIPYPGFCATGAWDCIRGDPKMMSRIVSMMYIFIPSDFCIILISMILVVRKIIQTDILIQKVRDIYGRRGEFNMNREFDRQRCAKASVLQAASYVLAFVLTLLFPMIRLTIYYTDREHNFAEDDPKFAIYDKISLILLPLQGFFNFVIFLSFKVYNYCRARPDVTVCQVLVIFFSSSKHDPTVITGISMVQRDRASSLRYDDDQQQQEQHQESSRIVDVDGHEANYELEFRLSYLLQQGSAQDQSHTMKCDENHVHDLDGLEDGVQDNKGTTLVGAALQNSTQSSPAFLITEVAAGAAAGEGLLHDDPRQNHVTQSNDETCIPTTSSFHQEEENEATTSSCKNPSLQLFPSRDTFSGFSYDEDEKVLGDVHSKRHYYYYRKDELPTETTAAVTAAVENHPPRSPA